MKILHSGNLASVGRNLCVGLRKRGIRADLVYTRYADRSGLLQRGDADWTYIVDARKRPPISYFDRLELLHGLKLTEGLGPSEYDILHFHHVLNPINMGLAVRNIFGELRPVILHFHGSVSSKRRGLNPKLRSFLLRRNCDLVLCSTPNILENVQDIPQLKRFLPNPVDTSAFRPGICSVEHHNIVLCWVKLESIKGIATVFRVARRLPGLRFHIPSVGLTGEKEVFVGGKPTNVDFIPLVPHSEVPKLICRYPLVLGQFGLGALGVSELEAMACGKPLIGFWNREFDAHYEEPCPIISSTDPKEISQMVKDYVDDSHLGMRCRGWVERFHSIDVVAEQLIEYYLEVVES